MCREGGKLSFAPHTFLIQKFILNKNLIYVRFEGRPELNCSHRITEIILEKYLTHVRIGRESFFNFSKPVLLVLLCTQGSLLTVWGPYGRKAAEGLPP